MQQYHKEFLNILLAVSVVNVFQLYLVILGLSFYCNIFHDSF